MQVKKSLPQDPRDPKIFQKTSSFLWKKNKLSQFSHNTEQSRPEGTNCNGPQAFPTVIMFVIRSFSRTQEVARQRFKETAVFPMKKNWPTFSPITEHGRYQATIY